MRNLIRLIPAGLLGAGAAVLVSCGSSGQGLIPARYAGPLKSDFQAVLQAAQEGDGNCAATDAKIGKTEADLRALPASVDRGLRGRLAEGVATLNRQARAMCKEPLSGATTTTGTSTTRATTPPPTTGAPTTAPTTGTSTSPSESPSEEGGATRAPGTGRDEGQGAGEAEPGSEAGASGGAEASENAAGNAGNAGNAGGAGNPGGVGNSGAAGDATGGTGSGK
jgi:hypothetical protein